MSYQRYRMLQAEKQIYARMEQLLQDASKHNTLNEPTLVLEAKKVNALLIELENLRSWARKQVSHL